MKFCNDLKLQSGNLTYFLNQISIITQPAKLVVDPTTHPSWAHCYPTSFAGWECSINQACFICIVWCWANLTMLMIGRRQMKEKKKESSCSNDHFVPKLQISFFLLTPLILCASNVQHFVYPAIQEILTKNNKDSTILHTTAAVAPWCSYYDIVIAINI